MVTSAWGGASDADVVALLLDARKGIDEEAEAILAKLPDVKRPKILILNKIDLIERSRLLALAAAVNEKDTFADTFMISALKGDGLDKLKTYLAEQMPEGPWLYPEDQISDAPLRMLAAEITREKIYERLHEELPYQSTVETDQWQQRPDGSIRIEQTVFVERDSQRKIVLGKGGQTIKAIGQSARKEIAEIAEAPGAPVPVREGARELGRRSRSAIAKWDWSFRAAGSGAFHTKRARAESPGRAFLSCERSDYCALPCSRGVIRRIVARRFCRSAPCVFTFRYCSPYP